MPLPGCIGMELDIISYAQATRLRKVFAGSEICDCTNAIRQARSVKTEMEIEMVRRSGVKHTEVYRRIPSLFLAGE